MLRSLPPPLPPLFTHVPNYACIDRFGVIATALQLIPVVSMVLGCTTTVGAALWAAELERLGEKANYPNREDVLPNDGEEVERKEL